MLTSIIAHELPRFISLVIVQPLNMSYQRHCSAIIGCRLERRHFRYAISFRHYAAEYATPLLLRHLPPHHRPSPPDGDLFSFLHIAPAIYISRPAGWLMRHYRCRHYCRCHITRHQLPFPSDRY
jgi:hypothetical protein